MGEPISLEPTNEDLRYAMYRGLLKNCPFCDDHRAMPMGYKNEQTSIYCYRVTCGNYECNATVQYNAYDRDEARAGAIRQWQRRAT